MKVSLAISHTPWIASRVESLARLLASLNLGDYADVGIFQDKAPNHVWSGKMWTESESLDVTHCLFLQDDGRVAPDFFGLLTSMISSLPDAILGLQVAHPQAEILAAAGHAWFTTSDGLVGVGYLVPREVLREFLAWRARFSETTLRSISEDTLLGLFASVSGHHVYHPLPTILDHDTDLPSTYANDAHANRRSRVRWDTHPHLMRRGNWDRTAAIPHAGRLYESTPRTLERVGSGHAAILSRQDDGKETIHREAVRVLERTCDVSDWRDKRKPILPAGKFDAAGNRVFNVSDLLDLQNKPKELAPGRTKLWLLAWHVRAFEGGPEACIDASISNAPEGVWPDDFPPFEYRTVAIADAEGRDYEHAASKLFEAIGKHPVLRKFADCPMLVKQLKMSEVRL